jgi:hypothetical protein
VIMLPNAALALQVLSAANAMHPSTKRRCDRLPAVVSGIAGPPGFMPGGPDAAVEGRSAASPQGVPDAGTPCERTKSWGQPGARF